MPAKQETSVPTPNPDPQALLSLMAVICSRNGHTFSWYTSKKSRVWLTIKGFYPALYSTSVEVLSIHTDKLTFDAIIVLMAKHIPKLLQDVPPLTTWHNAKEVTEAIDDAAVYVNDLWNRWQAGEIFWRASYPDAPLNVLDMEDDKPLD